MRYSMYMSLYKIFFVVVVLILTGTAGTYFLLFNQSVTENLERVNTAIAEPVNEVVPTLEVVAEGIGQLWGLDFIPDTELLVATERSGKLFIINTDNLEVTEVTGVIEVDNRGQGGLLDVAISPEFAVDNTIFLTYVASGPGGRTTHLARATLDTDTAQLSDTEVLYVVEPFISGGSHFGSRVVVDGEYLFMTMGDRGDKNFSNHVSQDTSNVLGTVLRFYRDGSIPVNNPFVGNEEVLNEIYSYGHRNPQGMAVEPSTGALWISDHGERDGDEINKILAGGNYGWPVTHTGCGYITGRPIGVLPWEREDIVDPVHYWECGTGGFPPAGMTFYDADGFLDWQGDLFVGGLASQYLAHFKVTDTGLEEQTSLLKEEGWRVRDVVTGRHDGALYVAVEGGSVSLVRIVPKPVE